MPSIDMFALLGLILVFILLGVLWIMPTEKKARNYRRRNSRHIPPEERKDWYKVSLKLERHIYGLRHELAASKKREKSLNREVIVHKEKYKRLQEKLSQERSWQEKEVEDGEKKARAVARLKEDFQTVEKNLSREHTLRLRVEREVRELKDEVASLAEAKRKQDAEITRMTAEADVQRKAIVDLRAENAKLSKKKEETAFVAKSEYDRVVQELKDRQKEIEQMKGKGS